MRRLSGDDVKEIFRLRESGMSIRSIASRMGVSQQAVSYHIYPKYRDRALERAMEKSSMVEDVSRGGFSLDQERKSFALIYFRCPKCKSYDISMLILKNRYECKACGHAWRG